ncbi:MAG TPA: TldD/PmbA family protein [Verrucomicrobiae bacterium]|jgi:predicted Zn-dependent protease|nr:TldD/PmbA family protein [Verrucomicrobiae bacterium]
MNASQRERLARAILERSSADQCEVAIAASDNALTRFTHESVHQNVAQNDVSVSIRAIVDGRTGVALSNDAGSEAALHATLQRAIAMAKIAPQDPNQPSLPAAGVVTTPTGAYDEPTARAAASVRAHMADAMFEVAERDGLWSAGFASTGADGITIANSNGALASFDGTDARVNVKMNAPDASGFAEGLSNTIAGIDAATIAQTAARKALDTRAPRRVKPGAWTVILEPAAFAELLDYIIGHFSAQSFDEGSSFFSEGLGEKYFGENVTIRDDFTHALAPSMPFDFEGQPKARVNLVENGVVRSIVTDSYWAAKLHRENSGHALPAPNAYGPQALNVVVEPGTKSREELIAQTPRGLLVSRFWYIRTVDEKQTIVTGMTRDGTYLIEGGELVGGVRNLRFNQSILEALRHCEFSSQLRRSGSYSYSMVVPTAKIERFTFTSTTEF